MRNAIQGTVLFAALAAAGCVTSTEVKEPEGDAGLVKRGGGPIPKTTVVREGPGTPGVVDYVMTVPENVVWVPWKMVGGGFKGASDGVQAGFDKDRMPLFGVIFSPVNLAAGFVTGFVEGLVMPPPLVGPSDDFGRVMASPTKRTTTVWWYP